MAKRDKKKAADAATDEQPKGGKQKKATKPAKEKKAKSSRSEHPNPLVGLMKQTVVTLVGGILGVILCVAGTYYLFIVQAGHSSARQLAATQGSAYLRQIEQQSNLLQAAVQQAANHPDVLEALRNPDKADLTRLSAKLTRHIPHATRLLVFPLNAAKHDNEAEPPISFAPLDQIRRAEKREKALPEIHKPGSKAYLNLVAPIIDGANDTVLGTIYVNVDLATLTRSLPTLENNLGYVEIVQQFTGSEPMSFYTAGSSSYKQGQGIQSDSGYPHWEALFYPGPGIDHAGNQTTALIIVAVVAIILVMLMYGVALLLLNRTLTLDVTRLTTAFNALTGREKHSATYTLPIFTSLSHTIDRLFHEYDAHLRHQSFKGRSPTPGTDIEVPLDVALEPVTHDDLDIDLNDDDTQLMGGADSTESRPAAKPISVAEPSDDILDLDVLEMADEEPQSDGLDTLSLPDEIFRAYDIRGIVEKTLTESVAQSLGMAIGSEIRDQGEATVLLARDGRNSSAGLASALLNGLLASGIRVIDIGMVPTPMLYFATHTLGVPSGVMVTGSHNPPEYNGFKVVIKGETLAGERIKALKERLENGHLSQGQGSYENYDITREYADRIVNDVVLAKPMRIVIDCGNGVAGPFATKILEDLGCSVTTLYGEIDGNFPNHHPDPSNPENLQTLIKTVADRSAEIGIAFDGDGDRLGVVLPSGEIVWPDRILMLYAKDLLARNPGADILYDVKCSRDVAELVSGLGGRAIMCATGHSLMKAKMRETGAVVGGELSGHLFFNERWYGFDDAIYAAARMLEILSMEPYDATQVFAEFPAKSCTPELHVMVSEARKFAIVEEFVRQAQFPDGNSTDLDGLRVDFADGWGLLRASNTTPALTLRFEADSDEGLERIKQQFRDQLLAVDSSLDVSF